MIKYADEISVKKPSCSKGQLQQEIETLEIKNYGQVMPKKHSGVKTNAKKYSSKDGKVC